MSENFDRNAAGLSMDYLLKVSQELSLARSLADVTEITRRAARVLCGADGATFVLKDGDFCYYVDEDAIGPLWKGRRFPQETCVSGWSMREKKAVLIEDITTDPRVPQEAYRATFVKSLVMVPIRESDPIGAIGNYWASTHRAPDTCIELLKALANLVAIALENVRLMEALQKSNQILEDSMLARDDFLSVASHELRTPLTSIKLQLQLLARAGRKGAEVKAPALKHATDLSLRQVDTIIHLVENLLEASGIRMKRINLELTHFDFSQAVREAVERARPTLLKAQNLVMLDLAPGIEGEWDFSRLRQVVENLLSNAAKHAAGSRVKIATRIERGSAILEVEDLGPGINLKDQARVFTRFEREIADPSLSGLGLGLYIAKNLVEAHQGSISLLSDGVRGTKFTAEFPLKAGPNCGA